MRALKRLLAILFGGILGIVLVVFGVKDFMQTKSLKSKGKTSVADVTDTEERSGRRGRRKYYVAVTFKAESGQQVSARERVSKGIYEEAASRKKINVTYLPDHPNVLRIGAVQTEFAGIGIGVFVMGFAAFSAIRRSE